MSSRKRRPGWYEPRPRPEQPAPEHSKAAIDGHRAAGRGLGGDSRPGHSGQPSRAEAIAARRRAEIPDEEEYYPPSSCKVTGGSDPDCPNCIDIEGNPTAYTDCPEYQEAIAAGGKPRTTTGKRIRPRKRYFEDYHLLVPEHDPYEPEEYPGGIEPGYYTRRQAKLLRKQHRDDPEALRFIDEMSDDV